MVLYRRHIKYCIPSIFEDKKHAYDTASAGMESNMAKLEQVTYIIVYSEQTKSSLAKLEQPTGNT